LRSPEWLWQNVVASAVWALLAAIYRRFIGPSLERSSPLWFRRITTAFVMISISGALAIGFMRPNYRLVSIIGLSVTLWIVHSVLTRFWEVGALWADLEVRRGFGYRAALKRCTKELYFMGLGASKLTHDEEFEPAIRRCNTNEGGTLKFLLIDPSNPVLTKAAQVADKRESKYNEVVGDSLRILTELRTRKRLNVEVRFYRVAFTPIFRLMFIDDELCLVSYYVYGEGDGSQLPQLHLMRAPRGAREPTSIYSAFKRYFEAVWAEATPVSLEQTSS
jgi:hypothetical protein